MSQVLNTVSKEFDYSAKPLLYGRYKYHRITPNEALPQLAIGGASTLTYDIPNVVQNLGISYLKIVGTASAASGANVYQHIPDDCIPFFLGAVLQPTDGQELMNIQDLQMWSKLSSRPETPLIEFKKKDSRMPFHPSRVNEATNKQADGDDAALAYEDAGFFRHGGNNVPISGTWYIPLKDFHGTILSKNKDLYFGQILQLVLTSHPTTRFLFTSDSALDPASNPAQIAANITFNFTTAELWLAEEIEMSLVQATKEKAMKGYDLNVPYVVRKFTGTFSSTNHIARANFARSDGRKLVRIYHTMAESPQTLNNVINTKKEGDATFITNWNGKQMQDSPLTYGESDYLWQKDSLDESCIMGIEHFNESWFYVENFGHVLKGYYNEREYGEVIEGIDLDQQIQMPWEINITFTGATDKNHVVYGLMLRSLYVQTGQSLVWR